MFSHVTVDEITNLDCMKDAKIIAGEAGKNRKVRNVSVMEVPDAYDWVSQGDLLLTTGYPICKDESALINLISKLSHNGCAGLAIKTKRYLDQIPQKMIDLANEYDFPLLELPPEATFSTIIHSVLEEILNVQATYLEQADQTHHFFMNILLNGGDLQSIVKALSEITNCPVAILDKQESICVHSLLNENLEIIKGFLDQRKIISDATLIDPLGTGLTYERTLLSEANPIYEYRTSIKTYSNFFGYLVIWNKYDKLKMKDFIAIEGAISIAALTLINERAIKEVERRYRNEFIDDLIYSSRIDEASLQARALHLGWDLHHDFMAMVIDINNFLHLTKKMKHDELSIQNAKDQLLWIIRGTLTDKNIIIGTKSDKIIMFVPQAQDLSKELFTKKFLRQCEQIITNTNNYFQHSTITIGIGRQYYGISGLKKSYFEALEAIKIGKKLKENNSLVFYEKLGIYRLLGESFNINELENYYKDTIGALAAFDRENNTELIKTLEAFFECDCNIEQTSKKLFVHYNTVVQRLKRIETISKFSLKSPEDKLNLQIGLKIQKMLSENDYSNDLAQTS